MKKIVNNFKQTLTLTKHFSLASYGSLKIFLSNKRRKSAISAISDWQEKYYGAQAEAINNERFLVYTKEDEKIPFRPEYDIAYISLFNNLLKFASKLDKEPFEKSTQGILEMNKTASEVYAKYQSEMPRFTDHNRLALKLVQRFDKPYNCCPSLHVAYSVFLDEVMDENISKETIDSVLYVKQHALVDVAFGIICAQLAYQKIYEDDFKNPTAILDQIDQKNARNAIMDYYDFSYNSQNLVDMVGKCFEEFNFEKVK
jgi:hypothetical protein